MSKKKTKDDLKKEIKRQEKTIKKHKEIIKSYKKLIKEYDDITKRFRKYLNKFENYLIEENEDEDLSEEELDIIVEQFKKEEENQSTEIEDNHK
nr:hypothetical protein [uncultured Flavobacterium sp.]